MVHAQKNGSFVEIVDAGRKGIIYDISYKRIELEGFIHWVEHLREKQWWSDALEVEFINACKQYYDRVLYHR